MNFGKNRTTFTQSTVAILAAMPAEIEAVKAGMIDRAEHPVRGICFTTGLINNQFCVAAHTGAGKVNAAMTTTLLLENFEPKAVICVGVGGRLNPHLAPGDIVFAANVAQHDYGELTPHGFELWQTWNPIKREQNPRFIPLDHKLLQLVEQVSQDLQLPPIETADGGRVPRIIRGTIVTGDTFCTALEKRAELRQNFQADAVDMEGGAMAQICRQMEIPCLLIRSISDIDEEIDQHWQTWLAIASKNTATLAAAIVGAMT